MKECRQCGKELPEIWSTDICLDCSKENLRKTFKENPDVAQTFKETIEDLRKPENVKKVAGQMTNVMKKFQAIQDELRRTK